MILNKILESARLIIKNTYIYTQSTNVRSLKMQAIGAVTYPKPMGRKRCTTARDDHEIILFSKSHHATGHILSS